MILYSNPIDVLSAPQVKAYFLGILESDLSSEDKYQKLLDYLKNYMERKDQMLSRASQMLMAGQADISEIRNMILSQVGTETGDWNLQEIVLQTETSIKSAVRRLRDSQQPDGGWGFAFQQSDCWATVHAVLCLSHARELVEKKWIAFDPEINPDAMAQRGMDWLNRNRRGWWAVEDISAHEKLYVYELSLVAMCFYQIGADRFDLDFSGTVSQSLDRLAQCQNDDGGWEEARNRTLSGAQPRTGRQSEVGATSFALRALTQANKPEYRPGIERAVRWLVSDNVQNKDGSWNYVDFVNSYAVKSISKTGDALQGIIAGKGFITDEQVKPKIDQAILLATEWLQSQERPIVEHGKTDGSGWKVDDYSAFGLENTCVALETLVSLPGSFRLPLLASSAHWLMKRQYKEGEERVRDAKDIGKWDNELTARITLSLIEYYKKLRDFSEHGQDDESQ